jgi:uncharacterized protein YpmB
MRRGLTLISVAITTFSALLIASIVYGYDAGTSRQSAPGASKQVADIQALVAQAPAAKAASTSVSAQQAATIAQNFLQRTDAYSIELADYNGVQAFKVTFSSGDIVYVSLSGEVLGTVAPEVQVASQPRPREKEGGGGGGHESSDHEHESGGDD